ncbi:MAG: hypothetical protein JWN95_2675 [Frankiales bacterium]|nr:hypothetical protein [Frankiales bacterium]
MTGTWLWGLLRRQPLRLASAALGIAGAVALLASLGSFLAHSKATMTERALRTVAVDWQVQATPVAPNTTHSQPTTTAADTGNVQSGDQTSADTRTAGDTADSTTASTADTDNVQSGDQVGPDTGAAELPDAAG